MNSLKVVKLFRTTTNGFTAIIRDGVVIFHDVYQNSFERILPGDLLVYDARESRELDEINVIKLVVSVDLGTHGKHSAAFLHVIWLER